MPAPAMAVRPTLLAFKHDIDRHVLEPLCIQQSANLRPAANDLFTRHARPQDQVSGEDMAMTVYRPAVRMVHGHHSSDRECGCLELVDVEAWGRPLQENVEEPPKSANHVPQDEERSRARARCPSGRG